MKICPLNFFQLSFIQLFYFLQIFFLRLNWVWEHQQNHQNPHLQFAKAQEFKVIRWLKEYWFIKLSIMELKFKALHPLIQRRHRVSNGIFILNQSLSFKALMMKRNGPIHHLLPRLFDYLSSFPFLE